MRYVVVSRIKRYLGLERGFEIGTTRFENYEFRNED